MSLFSEKDKIAAMENAVREQFRKHSLSHLRPKVRMNHGKAEIVIEGASVEDIRRASTALGGATPIISGLGGSDLETIKPKLPSRIEPNRPKLFPEISTGARIDTRKKLKD